MTYGLTRKWAFFVVAAALIALGGFGFGFVACLHLKSAVSNEIRQKQLLQAGNAPLAVRAQVLSSLRAFQAGYVNRDPRNVDSFMKELFPNDDQILVIGTEGGTSEWARGHLAATEFIRADWQEWGDFRFNVDNSILWSSGDVAWAASVGTVRFHEWERPVRFTAILTREGDTWRFRQLHFQWDDNGPEAKDVLRPITYRRLFRLALRRISGH